MSILNKIFERKDKMENQENNAENVAENNVEPQVKTDLVLEESQPKPKGKGGIRGPSPYKGLPKSMWHTIPKKTKYPRPYIPVSQRKLKVQDTESVQEHLPENYPKPVQQKPDVLGSNVSIKTLVMFVNNGVWDVKDKFRVVHQIVLLPFYVFDKCDELELNGKIAKEATDKANKPYFTFTVSFDVQSLRSY